MIYLGLAGNPEGFYEQGGTSALQMPAYARSLNLDAYEYQCTKGIQITRDAAEILGEKAKENNIKLSVHAPYFTDISSEDDEIVKNSVALITGTAIVADKMGANRVVIHMGSAKYITRALGLEITASTIKTLLKALDEKGLGHLEICPETMGRLNSMGTVDEVIKICQLDERLVPCLDFGHINSMTQGSLKSCDDFDAIFSKVEKKLGKYRADNVHCHFSKVEYTRAGELKHTTFEDKEFGPEFEPLAQVIYKRNISPTIICESIGTQDKDAVYMKNVYDKLSL